MSGEREALEEERRLRSIMLVVLLIVVIGQATDIYFDAPREWLTAHVLTDVGLMVGSAGAAIYLWRGWHRATAQLAMVRRSLAEEHVEREAWRERAEHALAGLAHAIDDQFTRWDLTPSEREVALLLLKGHGHKKVAALTGRSERTVRQHAVSVYEKSGLGGRAELAAFFLEGLMLPGAGEKPPP